MKSSVFRGMCCIVLLAFLSIALAPARAQDKKGKVAAALQPHVDSRTIAGAVALVADKDEVLSHDAVGFADLARMLAMPLDAIFWIASMSKPITGSALLILVDEGKVKLDDPIEKYLPEFKGQWMIVEQDKDRMVLGKPKRLVTVRDVLNHTSGLPGRGAMEQPTYDALSLRDAVRSYALTPLNSEPGTKYVYSNPGINVAGRIIEVASGKDYEDFLNERLFNPLGMKDTTFWPSESQLKRLAKSYKPGKDKKGLEETKIFALSYPLSSTKRHPFPGGGLFSTASDIGIFGQMVLNGGVYKGKRYLSEAAVKEMTSKQTGADIKTGYGLGWASAGDTFGHGGAYATNLQIDSKRGLVTVFMVQHAGGGNVGQALGAFRKAAEELSGK
jgi:CubicO group peptidase (beta-lactamase class C family)